MKMSENQLYTVEVEAVLKVAGLRVQSFATYHGVAGDDVRWYARGHYKNFLESMFRGYASITLLSDVLHLRVGDSYIDVPRHFIDPFLDRRGCSAIPTNPHAFAQDYLSHVRFFMDRINDGGYRFRVTDQHGAVTYETTELSKLHTDYRYYYDLADEALLLNLEDGHWRYNAKGLEVFYNQHKDVFVAEFNGENICETEHLQLLVEFLMSNYRERMYEEYVPKVGHIEYT